MKIGDLVFGLGVDDAGFQADVVKKAQTAGDAAGATMGQRLGAGLKTAAAAGMTAVGAAAGVAFGLGTKGLLELDTAMGNFQAETGATAEEAKSAGDAILDLSKRNLAPIQEIGAAMAALRTEMGLTQGEAEALTEPFLKFAEVTGQTGPDAVKAFDDILDSWNLTADDAQGIMDQLIASHQLYGGSVVENQSALTAMAPALQAANMDIDDGIGLLNMAAAAGIDASTASTAYTKALSKVKSPEELQQLIEDIRNTEDPFLRAQLAADLFGAKAGPKMAQLLGDGTMALDDYIVTQDEATGATSTAAAAFEGTFGNQAKIWIKNITGMATELVQNLGPGIGGIVVAAPLLGSALGPVFAMMKSGAAGVIPLLVKSLGLIGPALTLAMGPIGLIIAGVAALFLAWSTNFLGIRDIVGNVVGWLGDHVVPTIKGIFDAIASAVSTAVGVVTAVIGGIVGVVSTVAEAVAGFFDWLTGGAAKAKQDLLDVKNLGTTPTGQFVPSNPGGTPGSKPAPKLPSGKQPTPFAQGAWNLLRDQLAFLHRGEMVLPRSLADSLRDGLRGLAGPLSVPRVASGAFALAGGAQHSEYHNHWHLSVNGKQREVATPSEAVEELKRLGMTWG